PGNVVEHLFDLFFFSQGGVLIGDHFFGHGLLLRANIRIRPWAGAQNKSVILPRISGIFSVFWYDYVIRTSYGPLVSRGGHSLGKGWNNNNPFAMKIIIAGAGEVGFH